MSFILALTGCPFIPNTSKNLTGKSLTSKSVSFKDFILFSIFSFISPITAVPAKSPLTSAINTGTPASEKLSAITLEVIVLPVPDAPVIRPCLFAILGSKQTSFLSFFPINNLLFIYIQHILH